MYLQKLAQRVIAACTIVLLLAGCGMPLYTADLGKVHVEILDQPTVQAKCASGLKQPWMHPIIAYPLGVIGLGCAFTKEDKHGAVIEAVVYSVNDAGYLLHELDHIFNSKWCHTLLMAHPALCNPQ